MQSVTRHKKRKIFNPKEDFPLEESNQAVKLEKAKTVLKDVLLGSLVQQEEDQEPPEIDRGKSYYKFSYSYLESDGPKIGADFKDKDGVFSSVGTGEWRVC